MKRSAALLALVSALAVGAEGRADPRPVREALGRGAYAEVERLAGAVRGADRNAATLLLAQARFETGRYDEARSLATPLSVRGPLRAQALTLLGEIELAVGHCDEAVARWREAINAGPEREVWRARVRLLRWLSHSADRDVLREVANPLIDAYNDAVDSAGGRPTATGVLRDPSFLAAVGEAARALGATRNANQAFNEALMLAPGHVEANLGQAALMMTTEDYGPAGEAVRAALATNPQHAEGLLLRARLRLTSNHEVVETRRDLEAALAVNPRLTGALALLATLALFDDDVPAAERYLAQAEAINPRDLDLLTARALVVFHRGDLPGTQRALDAVFALAPRWPEPYQAVGDLADWEHRYNDAITVMREGLARPVFAQTPRLYARMQSMLGFNLLRMGSEEGGIAALQSSFDANRFNVRAANLLNFYQEVIPAQYAVEASGPFRVRYHREEAPVLRRLVPRLLQSAYDEMVARYHFTPTGPLSIELYASNEHFSVRTAGEPEIGVQGVCFGQVVTALSPRAGAFNWSQIVWHELAHVFAIQMSRSRVPRWFTEGLSEWEAFHGHPSWAREDDPALWTALQAGRIPRVADFNTAFTHARSGGDMLVAYYAASQLMAWLIERFGFDRVVSMLPAFGEGLTTAQALQRSLGVPADVLDRDFRAALQARLAPRYARHWSPDLARFSEAARFVSAADAAPTNAVAQAEAAAAQLTDGHRDDALARSERALSLDAHQALGRFVRATCRLGGDHAREALEDVDTLVADGHDGPMVRQLEVRAATMLRDQDRALRAMEALSALDPTQSDAWWALARAYERTSRPAERLRALREVVRLDQHHREALESLVGLLVTARDWGGITALGERVNELDPENLGLQLRVAHAWYERGDAAHAIETYETALAMSPPNAEAIRTRIAAVRAGTRGLPLLDAPPPRRSSQRGGRAVLKR